MTFRPRRRRVIGGSGSITAGFYCSANGARQRAWRRGFAHSLQSRTLRISALNWGSLPAELPNGGALAIYRCGGGCKRVHDPVIALAASRYRSPFGGVAQIAALVAAFHVRMRLGIPPDRACAKDDAVLLSPLINDARAHGFFSWRASEMGRTMGTSLRKRARNSSLGFLLSMPMK